MTVCSPGTAGRERSGLSSTRGAVLRRAARARRAGRTAAAARDAVPDVPTPAAATAAGHDETRVERSRSRPGGEAHVGRAAPAATGTGRRDVPAAVESTLSAAPGRPVTTHFDVEHLPGRDAQVSGRHRSESRVLVDEAVARRALGAHRHDPDRRHARRHGERLLRAGRVEPHLVRSRGRRGDSERRYAAEDRNPREALARHPARLYQHLHPRHASARTGCGARFRSSGR
jgi:hypothetical protein